MHPGHSSEYLASLPWTDVHCRKNPCSSQGPILLIWICAVESWPMRNPFRRPNPCSRVFFQNRHASWLSGNDWAPLPQSPLKVHAEDNDQDKVSMHLALLLPISIAFNMTHKTHRACCSKWQRVKIRVTHKYYSRKGEVKQKGKNAQLKNVRVKGEWPQEQLQSVGSSPSAQVSCPAKGASCSLFLP